MIKNRNEDHGTTQKPLEKRSTRRKSYVWKRGPTWHKQDNNKHQKRCQQITKIINNWQHEKTTQNEITKSPKWSQHDAQRQTKCIKKGAETSKGPPKRSPADKYWFLMPKGGAPDSFLEPFSTRRFVQLYRRSYVSEKLVRGGPEWGGI